MAVIGTSLHISACLQSSLLSTYLLYLHIKPMSDLYNISCFDLGIYFFNFFFLKGTRNYAIENAIPIQC